MRRHTIKQVNMPSGSFSPQEPAVTHLPLGLGELGVHLVGLAHLVHSLRSLCKHLHRRVKEGVDGVNVSLDGAAQGVEQRVEQTLDVVVNSRLHWLHAHTDTVHLNLT